MPRTYIESDPKIINKVISKSQNSQTLYIATTNENKLKEFKRLIPNKIIEGVDLKLDEIQSLNHLEVASK